MEKITADNPESKSEDPIQENLARLRAIFPEAFTEDGIDFDVLKEALGGSAGIIQWRDDIAPAVEPRIVFKDSGFADDVAKANMAAILNQNGISDVRSL